ncbi:MAG: amidohydrolase family protein [Gemmatimonadetes bacterium]|nr:amidohydrolase family protein [Gemmatimonadota bacterium]MBT6146511.1 amidohydrolase family protein [Gemmatimonadota bacterium]MBT7860749.1 amidohydrolase family protein [Gemmatimonadota bacterium]
MTHRIDTHTHFYDPTRPQGIPWPPADNELLYRTVLPEHHRSLAQPCGVTGTVVVEASAWLADNRWILDLADADPWIVGFIGHIDPGDDFVANLAEYADHPRFLGIRLGGGHFQGNTAEVDEAVAQLAHRQLTLDVLIRGREQAEGVARLAGIHPDLHIVLNHVAHVPIDGQPPDPEWAQDMQHLAGHAKIYCKVSGFVEMATQQPAPTDPAHYQPTFEALLAAFGEDRLIFGSNWPVSDRAAAFDVVVTAVEHFVRDRGDLAEKLWWRNGQDAYRFELADAQGDLAASAQ